MSTNYKIVEDRAEQYKAQANGIINDAKKRGRGLTDDERDTVEQLRGKAQEAAETAKAMRDAEIDSLRHLAGMSDSVSNANEIRDFAAYVRTGKIQNASMSSTDANGGYAIPNPLVAEIVNKLKASDPILARAHMFIMEGGNNTLEIPVVDALGATAWATETGARTEQNSPTFTSRNLTCYEVYTDWRATELFVDSVPGIENWIASEITETMLAAAGTRFATGTGVDQIKGMFANTSGYTVKLSGAADALANTAFTTAYAALPQKYHPGAVWVMKPATFGTVLSFVYPNTQTPLVQFVNGEPTILGKPVLLSDSAPAVGNGAYPVFFGDIARAYAIGMHRKVTLRRDDLTAVPYLRYYALARIGGVPLDDQAGVLIKSDDA